VQDQITDLPELNPEDLAELRTLGEIVNYMQANAPVPAITPAPTASMLVPQAEQASDVSSTSNTSVDSKTSIDLPQIETVMMSVVADKTGYPSEMLSLEMDMEADLGIDSIKRVEILGAVQDQITDLPELNPEDLAELRTLGEIITYMHQKSAGEQVITNNNEIEPFILNKTLTTQDADIKINDAATIDTSKQAPSAVVTLQSLPQVTKIANNLGEFNTKNQQKLAVLLVDDGTNTAVLLSHKLLASDCAVTVLQPNWQPCNKAVDFASEVKRITLGSEAQTLDEVELETLLTDQ
jgi:acyl carrier protein